MAGGTAVWVSLEPETGVSEILYPWMTVSVGECWAQVGLVVVTSTRHLSSSSHPERNCQTV